MGPISFGKQKENWRPLGTVTGSNKSTGVSSLAWSQKGEEVVKDMLQKIPGSTKGLGSKIRIE